MKPAVKFAVFIPSFVLFTYFYTLVKNKPTKEKPIDSQSYLGNSNPKTSGTTTPNKPIDSNPKPIASSSNLPANSMLIAKKDGFKSKLAVPDFGEKNDIFLKHLKNRQIKEAAKIVLNHSDEYNGLLNMQATGKPGEQERYREHSDRVFEEKHTFLKNRAYDAPELFENYEFAKTLYESSLAERDQNMISESFQKIEELHKESLGHEIHCLKSQSMSFLTGEMNPEFEDVIMKCKDDSVAEPYIEGYIAVIHAVQGEDTASKVFSFARKRFPDMFKKVIGTYSEPTEDDTTNN